ncbi:MAG: DAK2 domain-containing protein [Erysipelotrichaceae bacterium]|nr:DAK2 domain-containing protein [Erysipelotrichaceae bacterium]
MRNEINGFIFEKMMRNALNNLYVHEKEINDMNVFPVADGDTGTNMRLTLENGLNTAKSDKHLGKYLKELSTGMLLGARGNSGVILSQLFRGMYLSLRNDSIVNPGEFRDAFIIGYKTAYKAVLKPVEGTILTVTRMGIENIKDKIRGSISQKDAFKLYLDELNKSLELTPELLPVLKEANVLDSGAKGYITIIEGMYKYLLGQIVDRDLVMDEDNKEEKLEGEGDYLEISIKLNNLNFAIEDISKKIEELSSSYDLKIKDKILTLKAYTSSASLIIKSLRRLGDVESLNLENKKKEEDKIDIPDIPFKAIVYIACISGSGIKDVYKDMGVDVFLPTNPSTQNFLDAFKRIKSEKIVILPNDKNIIETANQAVKISLQKNIVIIPTKNVIEGYYALAMDVPDSSIENRLEAISEDVGVECLNVSKAIKSYSNDLAKVNVGDYVTYMNEKILSSDVDLLECLSKGLANYNDISFKSSAFILLGKNVDEDLEEKINELFSSKYENIEVTILNGGQEKEDLMIGLL